jgi:glucosamine 6-phosphate synthetase-like amidotransferase/phosphosugar isomerase protein
MFKSKKEQNWESGANCIKPSSGSLCNCCFDKKNPDEIVAARLGSPLAIELVKESTSSLLMLPHL